MSSASVVSQACPECKGKGWIEMKCLKEGEAREAASVFKMKRTFTGHGRPVEWFDARQGEGEVFLREATQVKNIWTPSGE